MIPAEELPRTGIVYDAPPNALVIGVAGNGTIISNGRAGGLPELCTLLTDLRKDNTDWDPKVRGMRTNVILRTSGDVPWPVVQWVMQTCELFGFQRLSFAVNPEGGGPEGVIDAFLPRDIGIVSGDAPWDEKPEAILSLFAVGTETEPGVVFAAVKDYVTAKGQVRISIDTPFPKTPRTSQVLTILDVARRAGAADIGFSPPESLQQVQELRSDPARASRGEVGSLPWLREWVVERRQHETLGLMVKFSNQRLEGAQDGTPRPLPPPPPRGKFPGSRALPWPSPWIERAAQDQDLDLPESDNLDPGVEDRWIPAPVDSTPPVPPLIPGGALSRRGTRLSAPTGTEATTNVAIDRGLAWLAAHQSPDGSFEAEGFPAWCDGKANDGKALDGRGKPIYDLGVTGLALLAFLAAGHTNRSEGPYGKVLGMGLKHLKNVQDAEGCIGPRSTGHFVYDHAIGALALVEAYAMTGSAIYKNPAQKALDFIALARNPNFAWRYGVKPGDNDTSVTAWMFLALDAARRVNASRVALGLPPSLTIDATAFDGVRAWIDKMTDPETGSVGYQQRGSGSARVTALADKFPSNLVEGLTAVGVFTRFASGETADGSEPLRRGIARIAALPPTWDIASGSIDLYSWRICAIAMARAGGEAHAAWRKALLTALLPHQRADGDVCGALGSWDPIDPWSPDGGRVYSTSMALLALLAPYSWEPPAAKPK